LAEIHVLAHGTLKNLKTYSGTRSCPQVKHKIKCQHLFIFYVSVCEKSTASLKLIDNLIVSPDTSILSMASAALISLKISGNFWTKAVTVCLLSAMELLVSKVATRILIPTYNLGPPIKLFYHYALSSLGTPDIPLRNPL
jgi:hypothetical protein